MFSRKCSEREGIAYIWIIIILNVRSFNISCSATDSIQTFSEDKESKWKYISKYDLLNWLSWTFRIDKLWILQFCIQWGCYPGKATIRSLMFSLWHSMSLYRVLSVSIILHKQMSNELNGQRANWKKRRFYHKWITFRIDKCITA